MTVFCLVELDGGAVDGGAAAVADVSLRAITLARELAASAAAGRARRGRGRCVRRRLFGGGAEPEIGPGLVADLAAYGVTDVYAVSGIDGYAPLAWARVLQWLMGESGHAVVAAGTERGNEVLAHLGAITGLPMAANCTQAVDNGGGEYAIVRQRWAGLLLEEAVLEAPVGVADGGDRCRLRRSGRGGGGGHGSPRRAVGGRQRSGGARGRDAGRRGRGVAGDRPGGGRRRPRRRQRRRVRARSRSWRRCSAASSASPGW